MPEFTYHQVPTFAGTTNVEVQRHGVRVGEFYTLKEAVEWVRERRERRPLQDILQPCCANEKRSLAGGCVSCGDPCL